MEDGLFYHHSKGTGWDGRPSDYYTKRMNLLLNFIHDMEHAEFSKVSYLKYNKKGEWLGIAEDEEEY